LSVKWGKGALEHLLKIKNNAKDEASLNHIKETSIAYLLENREHSKALDYCELIEEEFAKNRSRMNSLEATSLYRDIQKKILHDRSVKK